MNERLVSNPITAPLAKRLMRQVWCWLPRCKASFDVGKLLTRTLLRPESAPCPVCTRFAGTIPMELDLSGFVANDLYCMDDHYESVTLRLWRKLATGARTVLDVGSHIGTFALVAAEANRQARVVAVEVEPHNFELLQRHATAFPNLVAVQAAIASREGRMWFAPGGENDGGGRVSAEQPADPRGYAVETCTLEQLCRRQQLDTVDLMKLDVEGFEYELIVPDSPFWREFAPAHLIVELTVDKQQPQRLEAICRAMEARGYRAERLQSLYALPCCQREDLANWHFWRTSK